MLVFVFQHHHRANLRQILRGQSVLEQVLFDPQQVPSQIFLLDLLEPNVQMSKLSQSNKELFEIRKNFIKFSQNVNSRGVRMATFDKKIRTFKVELGLGAELPSPPGSMTSRSVASSASSKKSTKSNRSRDYA